MTTHYATVVEATQAGVRQQDAAVIKAAQSGDRLAYHQLYQQHVKRVYALCLRLTGDHGLAEDATQEVFIQLWRKLDNFDERSRFTTWLHSVTANVTISYMRKQRNWFQRMFSLEGGMAESQEAQMCSSEVDLDSYIRRLPEKARLVFVLHAIEGYRHEEVADMLNMAVGTSKAQFHRAKQLLKEWMGFEDA
ncbi:RNA polymerase sigma factor [Aestuariibacter sp. A3R04]|uniref:RNA polymerase sigma factor n=1 Tax=Aestuariibacter sp. A3R04 TaxID=2841571 RepID=UPI001C08AA54|nr:RNA polymerase sigma factor [Aestuariibacter sp. A3R04]MBU3023612.1 RNA polymerase sigma factor [Aestuariibacter sp. A3R04]